MTSTEKGASKTGCRKQMQVREIRLPSDAFEPDYDIYPYNAYLHPQVVDCCVKHHQALGAGKPLTFPVSA